LSEGLTVEASQDGFSFFLVGSFPANFSQGCTLAAPCGTSLDLASSGLASADFFRLTALPGGCVGSYPECYDFDTLEALNFTAAVPEPATWAMMLTGFGAIGYAMRRNRKSLSAKVA
jgi:PEP-CTERM motif